MVRTKTAVTVSRLASATPKRNFVAELPACVYLNHGFATVNEIATTDRMSRPKIVMLYNARPIISSVKTVGAFSTDGCATITTIVEMGRTKAPNKDAVLGMSRVRGIDGPALPTLPFAYRSAKCATANHIVHRLAMKDLDVATRNLANQVNTSAATNVIRVPPGRFAPVLRGVV